MYWTQEDRAPEWLTKESETIARVALTMLREADGAEVRVNDIRQRLVKKKLIPKKLTLYVADVMAELSYNGAVRVSRLVLGPAKLGGDMYYKLTGLGFCGMVRQQGVTKLMPESWDGGLARSLEKESE